VLVVDAEALDLVTGNGSERGVFSNSRGAGSARVVFLVKMDGSLTQEGAPGRKRC